QVCGDKEASSLTIDPCERKKTVAEGHFVLRSPGFVHTMTPAPLPQCRPNEGLAPVMKEMDVSSSLLDKRESRIRQMFGAIAPRYDLLNHLLSFNIDRYWRWRTTRLAPPIVGKPGGDAPILDVCTGTGD